MKLFKKVLKFHEKKTLAKIVETKFVGNKTYLRSSIVAQLVEALHYKLEGRGFDSRWYHWNFSLT